MIGKDVRVRIEESTFVVIEALIKVEVTHW